MQTVMEIEDAIGQLPEEEMFKLVERLENRTSDLWDRQIERDVKGGRLNSIAQQAIQEHRAGRSTAFPSDAE
jgi:hypothetical protein